MRSCVVFFCVLLTTVFWSISSALAGSSGVHQIGSEKQLFIDDYLIESSHDLTLTMNPPLKTGEHNIVADRPWEAFYASGWNTLMEDEGIYRMWYECSTFEKRHHVQNLCYATSNDGVHWEKPSLGLHEFKGSRDNNIVLTQTVGTVFLDPRAEDGNRFKFAARKKGLKIYTSGDGIHWKALQEAPVLTKGHFDTQNQVFWDDRIDKYVGYVRRWIPLRKIGRSATDDLTRWPEPVVVFSYDEKDPVESDHYNLCAIKYPFASSDIYLAFPSAYYHYPGKKNDGPLDIQLATSRDGIHWDRSHRLPYVRLGLEGSFDDGSIYMTVGMVRRQDELWMYYTAYDFTHGAYSVEKTRYAGVLSRLVQRLDGFVSADVAYEGGELTTVPLVFSGDRLRLNLDTGALGSARVEILDDRGQVVPGYSREDCDRINTNSTSRTVTWRGKNAVGALAGKQVKLRFVMRSAKLYAFQFVSK